MLYKQYGKDKLMAVYFNQNHSEGTIFWISLLMDSKDGVDFAILFTLKTTRESRRTSDPALSRVRGSRVQLYP
jgi:hypothetical protein